MIIIIVNTKHVKLLPCFCLAVRPRDRKKKKKKGVKYIGQCCKPKKHGYVLGYG